MNSTLGGSSSASSSLLDSSVEVGFDVGAVPNDIGVDAEKLKLGMVAVEHELPNENVPELVVVVLEFVETPNK